jgi:arylsulfatase A-like enzyme
MNSHDPDPLIDKSFHMLRFSMFCLLTLLQANSAMGYTQDPPAPNIVFLLTDDQATLTMGSYGNEFVRTPNLDDLANNGVTFDRHYVSTAICMASRANILTGLYEFRTGCNFTTGNLPEQQWQETYPMRFKAAGYRTAFAGKFGISIEGRKELPAGDFDRWGAGPGQTSYQTSKNQSMAKYAKRFPHSTLSYAEFSRDFIKESVAAKKPFCLSISFKSAHRPVTPDPKFNDIYKGTKFPKPANYGRGKGQHLAPQSRTGRQFPRFEEWGYADNYDEVMAKYNQQVYAVDVAIGIIRHQLKNSGVDDNTIIVFTSDNGFLCGSHGYGSKVLPYEESTSVPLIIFDPRHPSAGKSLRSNSLTGSIDLCPTVLDLAGLSVPDNIDGVSLKPLLDDPQSEVRKSLSLMNFWGPDSTHSFGVVTQQWKYLYWYSEEKGMTAQEELFDLGSDPSESVNAADNDEQLPQLNKMRELYESHLYEINEKAINEKYRKYKDLFDRKQTWDSKLDLLKPKRKKK